MNILWCGGEDLSFPNGSSQILSAGSHYRTAYARKGILSTSPSTPLIGKTFSGGAVTSAWLSCRLGTAGISSTKCKLIGLAKSGTNGKGIFLDCGGADGRIRVGTWDGSTFTALGTETNVSLGVTGVHKIDLQISSYGASAEINVYCNELLIITYTGDISVSGVSDLDCVVLFGYYYGGADTKTVFSEIVVADGDTRTVNLFTFVPSAAGDGNDWSGAYTDIDEVSVSDADLVYVNAADKDAQFGLSNTPAGSFSVDAIKIEARATAPAGSTADTLKLGVKSGGAVDVDAGQELTSAWDTYERLTATVNGSQITTLLLDAMQLNLRSAS